MKKNRPSRPNTASSPTPPDYFAEVTSKSLIALGDATLAFATQFNERFIPQDDSISPEKRLEILQTVVVAFLANASDLGSNLGDGVRSGSQTGKDR
jgi:hypothetical protein